MKAIQYNAFGGSAVLGCSFAVNNDVFIEELTSKRHPELSMYWISNPQNSMLIQKVD